MLLSDRFRGFFLTPSGMPWNFNFQGVRHNASISPEYALANPLEFYHETHRPMHYLTFLGQEDVGDEGDGEEGGEDLFA
jgi:pre-mRNA-processing factor 8